MGKGSGTQSRPSLSLGSHQEPGAITEGLSPEELITLETYEQLAQEWSSVRNTSDFWRDELATFGTTLPSGSVLDVGSGNGRDAKMLTEEGYRVTGIDISPSLLTLAQNTCPEATFQPGSVYDLPFKTDSFDGFWAAAILLHLPRQRLPEALAELKRITRPGGTGFIAVKEGEGEGMEMSQLGEAQSQRFFTFYQESELGTALNDNGLTVLKSHVRPVGNVSWLTYWVKA